MTIQQPIPVARLNMDIIFVNKKKEGKQICSIDMPSAQPLPEVGDEISIPRGMEDQLGTDKVIFRVLKRRFPIQTNGTHHTSVVLFVSDELE